MKNKHVNAIVVGAGAGGGVVAKELATSGLSVVLFERGDWVNYDQHNDDELICQSGSFLDSPFGPDRERYRRVKIEPDGSRSIVLPNNWKYNNVAACVGSGTVSYGAMAWRFMPEDFKMKTTYGHVEGSTLEDWPMSYDDLEPYYEKAEYEIGVSGDDSQNPFAPPRKKPQPMPAFAYNREGELLAVAAKKMGWSPFPIPMLRNSVRYNGRPACYHMRTCAGYACPVNAKGGTHNTVIPTAINSGNCELRTNSKVSEIIIDDKGRAKGVNYFDENEKGQSQTADIVIVSASATETARLLLNSKSKLFPDGAGNNNDWVGRNIQGHAYCGANGLFDEEIYDDFGPGACIAVSNFNHGNNDIIGGGVLYNEFTRMPYGFSSFRPPESARWGKEHKDFQRRYFKSNVRVSSPLQEMPNFEARVSIDPTVKDYWGVSVVSLSGGRHPIDKQASKFMADKAEEWLLEAGAKKVWKRISSTGLGGGHHQAGTARMGNDPKTSVTNKYGQIHEIDNLFVADGSLNVNNGGFNPALTILSLGYWVSDYIVKNWAGSKFR